MNCPFCGWAQNSIGHGICCDTDTSSGQHKRIRHQGSWVCDTCVNSIGLNVRWDQTVHAEVP